MKKNLALLFFAVLVFLGGALAGRQIMTPHVRSASQSDELELRSIPGTPDRAKPTRQSSPDIQDIRLAAFEQPIESVSTPSLTATEIREEIAVRFPELPEQTVAGWVDAYRDVTLAELRALLEERHMMKGLFPVTTFDATGTDDTSPKPEASTEAAENND